MLAYMTEAIDLPEEKRKIEKLYDTYHRLMYVIAFRILNHHEDTEDAVIASWEKIITHLDKIKEIDSPETKSFIVIIVERTSIDAYRKNKRRHHIEYSTDLFEQSPYFITANQDMSNVELFDWLRGLPKIYGEVLILHYVNELSGKEIADLLKIKTSTVMKRLERARKLLRTEMGL